MSSGVKLDPECVTEFTDFKLGKKHAFVVFGFNQQNTKIVVLHKEKKEANSKKNSHWQKFVEQLPPNDVRYAVVDVDYKVPEGDRTDMIFVTWAPEIAPLKKKMLMASSKDTIKGALVGLKQNVQANAFADLDLENIVTDKLKGQLITE